MVEMKNGEIEELVVENKKMREDEKREKEWELGMLRKEVAWDIENLSKDFSSKLQMEKQVREEAERKVEVLGTDLVKRKEVIKVLV